MPMHHLEFGRYVLEHDEDPLVRELVIYGLMRGSNRGGPRDKLIAAQGVLHAACTDNAVQVRRKAAVYLRYRLGLEPLEPQVRDALQRETDAQVLAALRLFLDALEQAKANSGREPE